MTISADPKAPTLPKPPSPSPKVEVCGASLNPLEIWERVRLELNPTGSLGNGLVRRRYFGSNDPGEDAGDILALQSSVCTDSPLCGNCPLMHHCDFAMNRPPEEPIGTTVDLFSGAGGLSLGFEQAGFQSLLAIDLDDWAIETHRYNRPNSPGISLCADLSEWLKEGHSITEVDILMGGPPCQSFSTANRQRKESDSRDGLYRLFIDSIPNFNPKLLLIENVRGFEKVLTDLCDRIEMLGYSTKVLKLNARNFGVPQNRARVFTIGVRNDFAGGPEDANELLGRIKHGIQDSKLRVRSSKLIDAIGDLPALHASRERNNTAHESDENGKSIMAWAGRKEDWSPWLTEINGTDTHSLIVFNHKARYNNDRDIEIFGRLLPGEDSTAESIRDIMPYADRNHIFKDKYYKLRPDAVCKTITAHMRLDCNMYIHPFQARGLTVREAARVQGFPDNYVFLGTLQAMYRQVGNAVPPPLAKIIAEEMHKELVG